MLSSVVDISSDSVVCSAVVASFSVVTVVAAVVVSLEEELSAVSLSEQLANAVIIAITALKAMIFFILVSFVIPVIRPFGNISVLNSLL